MHAWEDFILKEVSHLPYALRFYLDLYCIICQNTQIKMYGTKGQEKSGRRPDGITFFILSPWHYFWGILCKLPNFRLLFIFSQLFNHDRIIVAWKASHGIHVSSFRSKNSKHRVKGKIHIFKVWDFHYLVFHFRIYTVKVMIF